MPSGTQVPQNNSWSYSMNADGSRFLVKARASLTERRITAITNWRARLPADQR
jgi:hypothetical protein